MFDFSPIQEFIEIRAGIENTYMLMADEKDLLEEVFDLMHTKNIRRLKELVKTPAEVLISYENTSTTVISPNLYMKYCNPCLNEYSGIIHEMGKKYLIHMCGKLKGLQKEISQGSFDGVVDIAPSPTGDTELWEAKESFKGKIVGGGIDCTTFAMAGKEEAYERFCEIIEKIKHYRGVMIGSGDSVPYGTALENLRAFKKALDDKGFY